MTQFVISYGMTVCECLPGQCAFKQGVGTVVVSSHHLCREELYGIQCNPSVTLHSHCHCRTQHCHTATASLDRLLTALYSLLVLVGRARARASHFLYESNSAAPPPPLLHSTALRAYQLADSVNNAADKRGQGRAGRWPPLPNCSCAQVARTRNVLS